jgi:hypothetical protein
MPDQKPAVGERDPRLVPKAGELPMVRFDMTVKVDFETMLAWKSEQVEALLEGVAAIINARNGVNHVE